MPEHFASLSEQEHSYDLNAYTLICLICEKALHDALFEIALEGGALISLGLAMLHCDAPQVIIHHGGVNGCGPLLIHRGGLAQPVVNIIGKGAAGLFCLIEDMAHSV